MLSRLIEVGGDRRVGKTGMTVSLRQLGLDRAQQHRERRQRARGLQHAEVAVEGGDQRLAGERIIPPELDPREVAELADHPGSIGPGGVRGEQCQIRPERGHMSNASSPPWETAGLDRLNETTPTGGER